MVKIVEANWLAEQAASTLLVLDTRTIEEFSQGFIAGSINITCPSTLLMRKLKNGSLKVECLLNMQEDKEKFAISKESEAVRVIVTDSEASSPEAMDNNSVGALLLKKLARDCKFVAFLSGGFAEFSQHYPSLCELQDSKDDLLQRRPSSLVLPMTMISLADQPSSPEESPNDNGRRAPYEILPHLYLGCRKVASSLHHLKESGITRILNVTSTEPNNFESMGDFQYKQIAVEDSHDVNMVKYFPEAFSFIEEARACGEKVLVHCHAGMSRSVTVILAYLMRFYHHTMDTAYDLVKRIKPNISPNFGFLGQLLEFECSLSSSPADSGFGSHRGSPVDEHCFLPAPVLPTLSRSFVLAN